MLSLTLAIFGGSAAILSGAALWWNWQSSTRAKIQISAGLLAMLGGFIVWDYQERKDNWQLSKAQKASLTNALRDEGVKFPVVYFPINAEPLAHRYAYSVLDSFVNAGWPYLLASPNWVVPTQAHGLMITTCPNPRDEHKPRVRREQQKLKELFLNADISVSDQASTEQALSPNCLAGLILGQPPSPCDRVNPSLERFWNPVCWIFR